MKIEIMYPELCCLYGDKGNTKFLQQCLPEAEFVYTQLNEKPHFLTEEIDLCCMYSMSEQSQELILNRLLPHQAAIAQAMESGKTLFLLTGNALELLGKYMGMFDGSGAEPEKENNLLEAILAATRGEVECTDIPELQQTADAGHDMVEPAGSSEI